MSRIDVCFPQTISPCKSESSFGRVNVKACPRACQHRRTNFRLTLIVSFQCFEVLFVISSDKSFDSRFVYILSHTLVHSLQFSISLIIVSCTFLYRLPSLPNCLLLVCWLSNTIHLFSSLFHPSNVWFALLVIIVKHTFNSSILYCICYISPCIFFSRCYKVNCAVYEVTHGCPIDENSSTMRN